MRENAEVGEGEREYASYVHVRVCDGWKRSRVLRGGVPRAGWLSHGILHISQTVHSKVSEPSLDSMCGTDDREAGGGAEKKND